QRISGKFLPLFVALDQVVGWSSPLMFKRLSPKTNRMIVAAAFVAVAAALPTVLSSTLSTAGYSVALNMLIKAGYFAIAALGLNIIVGYCGLLNLGFAGFMLIGSYTTGILMKEFNFPFWLAY